MGSTKYKVGRVHWTWSTHVSNTLSSILSPLQNLPLAGISMGKLWCYRLRHMAKSDLLRTCCSLLFQATFSARKIIREKAKKDLDRAVKRRYRVGPANLLYWLLYLYFVSCPVLSCRVIFIFNCIVLCLFNKILKLGRFVSPTNSCLVRCCVWYYSCHAIIYFYELI